MTPETTLWRSVVLRVLLDAAGLKIINGTNVSVERLRREAVAWTRTRDLVRVCTWADLDPQRVRAKIRELAHRADR